MQQGICSTTKHMFSQPQSYQLSDSQCPSTALILYHLKTPIFSIRHIWSSFFFHFLGFQSIASDDSSLHLHFFYLFFHANYVHYSGSKFAWWLSGKEFTCQCRRHGFSSQVRKIPWRRKWQPTLVFLPGEFHGLRSLVAYIVHGVAKKSAMTFNLISVVYFDTYFLPQ